MVVQLDYKKGVFFEFISQYLHRIKHLTKIFDKTWLNRHYHWTCACDKKVKAKTWQKWIPLLGFTMEKYTLVPSLVQGYLL